ncbi:MAG TPA: VanZ family protein [Verrucomicrobiae bacterium]
MSSTTLSTGRFRWLAAVYVLIIALVVMLANDGHYSFIFTWIRAIPDADKIGHFVLMGGLSFVVNLACGLRTFTALKRPWLLGSAIVTVIVVLEEISQAWVPTRTFDLVDLLFDFLGIYCFALLARRVGVMRDENKDVRGKP